MSPKRSLSTREITALLAQLSTTSQAYPPELLAARRSKFLKQASGLKIDLRGLNGKALTHLHSGLATTLEGVLQTVLGVMLAGLVVTAAVVYREEIVDFFTPDDGGAVSSEVAPLPVEFTPTPTSETSTPTSLTPSRLPSRMATPSATVTPVPDEPKPTDDSSHGKKLGLTPTPPGQRDP